MVKIKVTNRILEIETINKMLEAEAINKILKIEIVNKTLKIILEIEVILTKLLPHLHLENKVVHLRD